MTVTVAVPVFPGTNCEHDVVAAVEQLGGFARLVFHAEHDLGLADAVIIPGGFAHGDHLRPGAIARFSPVMSSVIEFARSGGPIVGICNGFQVLTEAGLLPGALQKNAGLHFLCQMTELEVTGNPCVLTSGVAAGTRLRIPINHFEGNWTLNPDDAAHLADSGQVVLRYVDNPNGSVGDVAGISNEAGNVVGLMPHPERATHALLGSEDGSVLLGALLAAAAATAV